jgi:hypothetical protein
MFFTITQINNGFEEAIRLALVQGGYLPDVLVTNTQTLFNNACNAIKASGKPVIRVFGVGNYKARGEIENNKIVIDRLGTKKGSIGAKSAMFFEENLSGNFTQKEFPKQTTTITYQISWVTSEQSIDDLITGILHDIFDEKGVLFGYDNNGTKTELPFTYHKTDESGGSNENYIERIVRFDVTDVFISTAKTIAENIPPMIEYFFTEQIE